MRTTILASIATALAGAALLAGCGGGERGDAASKPTTTTIRVAQFEFAPSAATIKAGQAIAVSNADAAPHTLTERRAGGRPRFDTGTLEGRRRGSFTVRAPGTYAVYCILHPFMKGTVTAVS